MHRKWTHKIKIWTYQFSSFSNILIDVFFVEYTHLYCKHIKNHGIYNTHTIYKECFWIFVYILFIILSLSESVLFNHDRHFTLVYLTDSKFAVLLWQTVSLYQWHIMIWNSLFHYGRLSKVLFGGIPVFAGSSLPIDSKNNISFKIVLFPPNIIHKNSL